MSTSTTEAYLDKIFEMTGLAAGGIKRLVEIRDLPEKGFRSLVDGLSNWTKEHYEKNTRQIIDRMLEQSSGPKAFYFGTIIPLMRTGGKSSIDWFIRESALYYDKLVIRDPFYQFLSETNMLTTKEAKEALIGGVALQAFLSQWVKAGVVELIPDVMDIDKELGGKVADLSFDDRKDGEWSRLAVSFIKETGSERETFKSNLVARIKSGSLQSIVDSIARLQLSPEEMISMFLSLESGIGFVGGMLTNSSPTTDWESAWRSLGLWASRRAKSFAAEETLTRMNGEAKVGRAWHQLEIKNLGALMILTPEQIVKVRDDSKLSLRSFREELGEKVRKIETARLADEKETGQVVSQVSEDLNKDAKTVERELRNVRLKIGVSAALTPLSLSLGLLPFPLAELARQLIGSASLVGVIGYGLDMKQRKERSGYFLVRLEEEAEEQEILKKRGAASKWHL